MPLMRFMGVENCRFLHLYWKTSQLLPVKEATGIVKAIAILFTILRHT